MNTNDLKTFEILPFGATPNNIGAFPAVEPVGRGLLDGNLVKAVEVVDTDTGQPLPNVHVFAKNNPARGGYTDGNGNITLVAQSPDEVIVFSWQGVKREFVFRNLGSLINMDITMTQAPVVVTAKPVDATPGIEADKKTAWFKWVGIGVGAVVLLSMMGGKEKPKRVKV